MFAKIRIVSRNYTFPSWSIPIALLVLTLLSFGLRAFSLGFFWDDLPYLWFFHRLGTQGIIEAFTKDRPFLSFLYNTTLSIFGSSIPAWQGFALLARWLCSLGLWWALAQTWPRHAHKAAWAVFLFTIYPGFTQQYIAVIYSQAFFLYASLFFSIGITVWLARRPQLPRWIVLCGTILALGLSAFTMFSTEYFFGLELLRPILLWLVLGSQAMPNQSLTNIPQGEAKRKQFTAQIRQTLAWWLPFLLLMIVFVIWRGFIQIFPAASFTTIQGIEKSPVNTIKNLFLTILENIVEAIVVAWGQPTQLGNFIENGASAGLRQLGIILGVGVLTVAYLARLGAEAHDSQPKSEKHGAWGWQALLVGALILLASGWPIWITGLPMRMGFPQDRYTLPMAPGVCLMLAGLVDLLGGQAGGNFQLLRKAVMLGIAVGLAAGFHNTVALDYRQDWNRARDFFWQLTWRAPAVQPDTLFLIDSMPFAFYEDDSLSAPLNWTYDPDGHTQQMNYILYDILTRRNTLGNLKPGVSVIKDFRATVFNGSTSQALVVYYAPPGCVRVLDPYYDAELYRLPDRLQDALPLSNPHQLTQDSSTPATPPSDLFGKEPDHNWCYYFEKADLARQKGDWQAILLLRKKSISVGIRPKDPSEYLPFVEAYAQLGLQDDAYELTKSTLNASPATQAALCAVWNRAIQSGITLRKTYQTRLRNELNCSIP